MSTPYEIPLSPRSQAFYIGLGGVTYWLRVRWNVPASCWVMDVFDVNKLPLLTGVALVAGADLFAQFAHLSFGGKLVAQTDGAPSIPPNLANLGSTGHVYFVTP